jgi:transposase
MFYDVTTLWLDIPPTERRRTLATEKKAYHNLWTVELAFRIAKSKIEVRPMFHFTKKKIEAHICICFVALKVYKELDRILKLNNINMSVDKVLRMAKTITTLQIRLPLNNEVISKVMIMKRHKVIERLFNEFFFFLGGVRNDEVRKKNLMFMRY